MNELALKRTRQDLFLVDPFEKTDAEQLDLEAGLLEMLVKMTWS